jgi:tetratricopeptide (TPR) repeat protein
MNSLRVSLGLWLMAALLSFLKPAAAAVYPIILKGTVVMPDGSPPPFTAGIERICSDNSGSAPGPTTNKKGEYLWRMDYDPLATRACYLRATHSGYTSTSIEISSLDTTRTVTTLPPLVLSQSAGDPSAINVSESNIPLRAKRPFTEAMKALDTHDYAQAASRLQAAVAASPKFAQGWHALGVVNERLQKPAEARQAYERAMEAEPKLLSPYVMLARLCVKTKDWQCATKTADALIKADPKRTYSEIYLHRAVALYGLKDFDGAMASVEEALRLDPQHKRPREEYVLGRILEAKGDAAGAREHMAEYLKLDPAPADVDLVRGHLENLGKPGASGVEPDLEVL